MSENGIDLQTGVGRVVWGDPTKARKKIDQTTKVVARDKDGNEIMETAFGVAFPKADFVAHVWPSMAAEIGTAYPSGIPGRFAYKYVDGDTVDAKGIPYAQREGYAGCIVLTVTSRLDPPQIFKLNGAGTYDQLPSNAIKCGDYIALGLNFKCVPAVGTNTPSIYVNPRAIEFVGYGTEIVSTAQVDPNAMFGGRQHQLPPGATAAPVAGTPSVGMPGMPGAAPAMMAPAPAAPMMAPPPAMAAPPPPPPTGPQRPVDPAHIAHAGTASEQWWNGVVWVPAPQQAPLPPPAPDFVAAAVGMPAPAPVGMPGMPGTMPPR